MPDVEFVDPDAGTSGADEELAAGARERPRRRWPVPVGIAAVVIAAAGAVLLSDTTGGETTPTPSASVILGAPLPIPRPFPSRSVAPVVVAPLAPRCPGTTACRVTAPLPDGADRVRAIVRPVVAAPRVVGIRDARRDDGRLVQRVITAIGDTRTLVISVCRVDDVVVPRTLETREQSYQSSLTRRGYLVTVQIGDPAGLEGGGIPEAAQRIATDPRLVQ
ncbi:hypothetical protein [Jatrophihabitans fulvus]